MTIDLASDGLPVQYTLGSRGSDDVLHTNGLFKTEEPETPTLVRLLINNTVVNNQTVIYCNRHGALGILLQFLFIVGPF